MRKSRNAADGAGQRHEHQPDEQAARISHRPARSRVHGPADPETPQRRTSQLRLRLSCHSKYSSIGSDDGSGDNFAPVARPRALLLVLAGWTDSPARSAPRARPAPSAPQIRQSGGFAQQLGLPRPARPPAWRRTAAERFLVSRCARSIRMLVTTWFSFERSTPAMISALFSLAASAAGFRIGRFLGQGVDGGAADQPCIGMRIGVERDEQFARPRAAPARSGRAAARTGRRRGSAPP